MLRSWFSMYKDHSCPSLPSLVGIAREEFVLALFENYSHILFWRKSKKHTQSLFSNSFGDWREFPLISCDGKWEWFSAIYCMKVITLFRFCLQKLVATNFVTCAFPSHNSAIYSTWLMLRQSNFFRKWVEYLLHWRMAGFCVFFLWFANFRSTIFINFKNYVVNTYLVSGFMIWNSFLHLFP